MRRSLLTSCAAGAAAAAMAPLALAAHGQRHAAHPHALARAAHAAARPCKAASVAGTLDSVGARSFVVDVLRARGARGAATVTVKVAPTTRVLVGVHRGAVSDLAEGQRVVVVGRSCASSLVARLVLARAVVDPAKTPTSDGDEGGLDAGATAPAAPAAPAATTPAVPAPVGPSAADQGVA